MLAIMESWTRATFLIFWQGYQATWSMYNLLSSIFSGMQDALFCFSSVVDPEWFIPDPATNF